MENSTLHGNFQSLLHRPVSDSPAVELSGADVRAVAARLPQVADCAARARLIRLIPQEDRPQGRRVWVQAGQIALPTRCPGMQIEVRRLGLRGTSWLLCTAKFNFGSNGGVYISG